MSFIEFCMAINKFQFRMQIFTQEELTAAKNHKYSGTDDSLMVRFCFKYIWNWMVEKFPMWLAPNVITLTGFLFEVVSFCLSFHYSSFMKVALPDWLCIVDGACLLIYQTLDNLDGKQARRTGSSSSLGQFFDHGCDAITGCLELMKASMVFEYHASTKTFVFVSCMGIGFLLTTWEEFCTHKFYLGYLNGPDEGLFLLGLAQISCGIKIRMKNFYSWNFFNYAFIIGFVFTLLLIFYDVFKEIWNEPSKIKQGLLAILPCFITFGLFLANAISMKFFNMSPYFIMLCGLVLQYGGQMIIVAILTGKSALSLFSAIQVIEWILIAVPLLPEIVFSEQYWMILFYAHLALMLITDINVVYSLSTGLGIPIFTIKHREQSLPSEQMEIVNIEEDEGSFAADADPEQVDDKVTQDPEQHDEKPAESL
ncbi:CDP-alcohol phosphatidyltransferase family protein [Trichomonas vaginalis G3]|uniref:CDP-alcohol phosphatidyltransferase family protein n=1 Tax=Trichomonas vaginalis (strain ATCC PRA-98 / G3) TaxID=412133 RepID=A2ETJ8_TRIV3|nr:CDP-alcohol phosphatidyltransferase class-I family [Trichomonas vaginalis G3]EAY04044.1 CDP-alcohol phosphatidyltransferase family protein [Trichomonas vaginalis G3]KAI5538992.1 CDP-alcohol phosphatidyltransferase class-I family [Trichomonas vaginalis G3]|eukprot:XP_001316267.1 CDP-alcohol phosphatidyltransferase family protein [Trichomonas vaginalis G3]